MTPNEARNLYPIGCMVRDKRYGTVSTVIEHRPINPLNPNDDNVSIVVQFGDGGRATFPNPKGRIERVHVLTHTELLDINDGVPVSEHSRLANRVISRHLNPTVEQTFTVTVTRNTDHDPVTAEEIAAVLTAAHEYTYEVKEA